MPQVNNLILNIILRGTVKYYKSLNKDLLKCFVYAAGVVQPLCQLLTVNYTEAVDVALKAQSSVLQSAREAPNPGGQAYHGPGNLLEIVAAQIEQCGGLTRIEALKNHENHEINQLAHQIIGQYFSGDIREYNVLYCKV